MNYSLSAGGKRIRPVLVLEFCRVCGKDYKNAKAPACAVEMIHTSSLIHDDLPAMDNDDLRRGKPSCHKAYDEATAILAGDALMIKPFEIIADAQELDADVRIKLISELSSSFGTSGVIGGQVIDIENEKRDDVDTENLDNMYAKKTGALLRSACRMGCISAGAYDKIKYADEYAQCMGLAFQIKDDVLDVISSSEILGKPSGSDEQQNKTTYVTLLGVEKSMEKAEILTGKALKALDNFSGSDFLKDLTYMLLERKN
jgi:geranylgeranyl diphosphate synthase type II